jgi:O-antigen/teichoic acid export membrane protein
VSVAAADTSAVPAAAGAGTMVGRVGRNSAWLIAQPLVLNVLSVVSTAYIARKLGASDYGAFNLGFAQIALFSPLCNLGLRAVAVRAIAEDRPQAREIVGAAFALRILFTALAALLAAAWLAMPTYSLTTRVIGAAALLSMVFQSAGMVAVDLFQGFERAKLAAQPQLAGGLILTLLSVLALAAGLGLPGFVAAYVVGALIQMLLLHATARRHFFPVRPVLAWQRVRDLFRQARPFAVMSVLSAVTEVSVVDILILGALFPAAAVGAYAAAMALVSRLYMVPYGIADAMYPAVAHRYGQDRDEVEAAVRRYVLNLLLIVLPLALWLSLAAPAVLGILFGGQYAEGVAVLRLAAWLIPLMGFGYLVRECLNAVRRQGTVMRLSLVSGALLLLLYAALIPVLGPVGAAAAGLAHQLLMLPLWLRPFREAFRSPIPSRDLAALALALGAMALPFLPLAIGYSHAGAVFASAAGWAGYAAAVVFLRLVDLPAAVALVRRRLAR